MRYVIFFTLLNLVVISTFANNKYDEVLVNTFYIGSEKNELLSIDSFGSGENQPSSMTFDTDNNLIICDTLNRRIVIYNNKLELTQIFNDTDSSSLSGSSYIKAFGKRFIMGVVSSTRHNILDRSTGEIVQIDIDYRVGSKDTTRSIFTENVIFSYLADGSLCSFLLEDRVSLKYSKILSELETLELFNNKSKYGLEGYRIDNKKRIFFNDYIQNRDYKTLYQYWSEQHSENNEKSPRKLQGVPAFERLKNANPWYIGSDADGNNYRSGKNCIIFDKNGWVLDYFKFNNRPVIKPAVNFKGDVYYLYGEEVDGLPVYNLYKIKRQW